MTGSQLILARIVFAGAIAGSCALGLAVQAGASPCDPVGLAMTPQPVLSCSAPDAVPPADPSQPAAGPVNVADAAPPNAAPPPGQAPYVPPVAAGNGPPAGSQLGFLRQVWHEFHNGVPSELLYGPDPTDPALPPPQPGDPLPPSQ